VNNQNIVMLVKSNKFNWIRIISRQ